MTACSLKMLGGHEAYLPEQIEAIGLGGSKLVCICSFRLSVLDFISALLTSSQDLSLSKQDASLGGAKLYKEKTPMVKDIVYEFLIFSRDKLRRHANKDTSAAVHKAA